MIRFSEPLVLWTLVLLPLVYLTFRGRSLRRVLIALRLTVIALLVLAAAGLEIARGLPDLRPRPRRGDHHRRPASLDDRVARVAQGRALLVAGRTMGHEP